MSAADFKKRFEGSLLAVLIALNGFFIKRLVDEIDNTKQIAIETQRDVAVIKSQLSRYRKSASNAPWMPIIPALLNFNPGVENEKQFKVFNVGSTNSTGNDFCRGSAN